MSTTLARLESLLEEEHQAARRADVACLLRLQSEKAPLIDGLRAGGNDPMGLERAEQKARANIRLMRQLAQTLREFARGPERPAYDRRGTVPPQSGGASRGVL